ncbi:TPA: hypothetical protein OMT56_004273 [Enterobacter roggenkampii]|nr:hypothetical protein [Enterobacter roggenkampii]
MSESTDAQNASPFDEAPEPHDPQSYGAHNKRFLAQQCIGVPVNAGKPMYTTNCPVQPGNYYHDVGKHAGQASRTGPS